MKRSFFLYVAFVVLFLTVAGTWSAGYGQEQPRSAQQQASPPSTPSQAPSGEPQYRQNPNDSNTPPSTPTSPRTSTSPYETERSSFSWGSLLLGVVIGGVIGYFIGNNNPRRNVEIRRDRVA